MLPDFIKPIVMQPDVLYVALGAVFLQHCNKGLHPVVYFIKKYIPSEKKLCPLTIKSSWKSSKLAKSQRCYTDRHPTTVFTDYKTIG